MDISRCIGLCFKGCAEVFEVFHDRSWVRFSVERYELSQKFAVAQCWSSRSIGSHCVLVMLMYLGYPTRFVPFQWSIANLILDSYVVTYNQRCKSTGVFSPLLPSFQVANPQCLFPR